MVKEKVYRLDGPDAFPKYYYAPGEKRPKNKFDGMTIEEIEAKIQALLKEHGKLDENK